MCWSVVCCVLCVVVVVCDRVGRGDGVCVCGCGGGGSCVVRGAWHVAYGVRCAVYGVRRTEFVCVACP